MEKEYKSSIAQRKATKKYAATNMSKISLHISFEERDIIIENAKKYNLPNARYMRNCVKYCINHNINIRSQIENGKGI